MTVPVVPTAHDPLVARIFFGAEGLRPGFRVLVFWGLGVVWTIVAALALSPAVPLLRDAMSPGDFALATTAIVYVPMLALPLFLGLFDRGRLRSVGLGGPIVGTLVDGVGGAALGAGLLGLTVALIAALPTSSAVVVFEPRVPWSLLVWFPALVVAAAWEEVAFRGYAFQWLVRGTGNLIAWAASYVVPLDPDALGQLLAKIGWVALFSLAFGAAHGSNPDASWLAVVNTVLAGVWFGVAVLRSGALWFAIAMHFAWNFTQGCFFGLPISGLGGPESGFVVPTVLVTTLDGPAWATGGGYGVEASVPCTVVLFVAIAVSALWPARDGDAAAAVLRPRRPAS